MVKTTIVILDTRLKQPNKKLYTCIYIFLLIKYIWYILIKYWCGAKAPILSLCVKLIASCAMKSAFNLHKSENEISQF